MLVFIVFVLAEIRNVLVSYDPYSESPLTIWEETVSPAQTLTTITVQ